jgi:AAA15 family ATPase/GTPase
MAEQKLAIETKLVPLENLYLDPNNYRLIHESNQINVLDEKIRDKDVVSRTYQLILGEKNQNIQDLVDSFRANGYLPVDQIQVRSISDNDYVVVEGNRRVAALKYLCSEYTQKSIDLGRLDSEIFKQVPVVIYDNQDKSLYLTLMGLKHISGNKKWGEWNQAKLLEDLLTTYKLSEDTVCKQLVISKKELRGNIRALALANQYQKSDYGDQFNESMFPIFREASRNIELKEWIGWDDNTNLATNTANCELLFSWLSREPVENETDSEYSGRSENYSEPAISKRDDIRILSKILDDRNALKNLEEYRNLHEAYRTSDIIFKEKIRDAISSIASDVSVLEQLSITQDQTPSLEESLSKLRGIIEKTRSVSFQGVDNTSPFYDRIDRHFSRIKVTAYRGLVNLEVNKLSKINLFAGINNSGKTSLLEAIYLLCKQNDFNGFVDVLRRRGKIQEDHISPKWLAEQINQIIKIEGEFDNKKSDIEISSLYEDGTKIDRTHYLKTVDIETNFEKYKLESSTRIYQGRSRETSADSIKILTKAIYSSPFFLNESYHYTMFYNKSVQSKSLPRINDFIRNKIVPTVKDIRLVDEFQRFLVDDDTFEKEAMDLTSYGEGLQRIFFISLLFASAENGVILIDEFENAIHVELLENFSQFIYELAKEFNVQVFLTSHSKECIDAFIKSVPEKSKNDFAFHALVKQKNNLIIIREYDGEKYFKLLDAGDVDLRRAR